MVAQYSGAPLSPCGSPVALFHIVKEAGFPE